MDTLAASTLRKFFDKVTRDAGTRWEPKKDSARFLQALLAYDDPPDLLYRLSDPKERGMALLKQALMQSAGPQWVAQYVVPLLRLLGGEALSGSMAPLLAVLEALFRVPGLLQCLDGAITAGKVADASPVGWFLLTLASQLEEVRQSPEVKQLADTLLARGGDAEKVARRLKVVLAGTAATGGPDWMHPAAVDREGLALEDLIAGPGGRHDNDHVDYRSIKIQPTSDEATCPRMPYLPRSCEGEPEEGEIQVSDPHAPPDPEAALLDRHFRLLREDLVQPLRQALAVLGFAPTSPATAGAASGGQAQQEQHRQQRRQTQQVMAAAAAAQQVVFPLVEVIGTALRPRPCVLVAVALPPSHRAVRMPESKEREEFWSEHGKGTLPIDSLVCIARRVAPGQPPAPLLFGTVVRRIPKEMAREAARPVVGLAFERGQAGAERLLAELGRGPVLSGKGLVLVQACSGFFAVRPVLSCLQSMSGVPLAEELVHVLPPKPLTHIKRGALGAELAHLSTQGVTLDPSQRAALQACLSQRVALVQGPPGTGKTFVGVLLCDALLRHSSETILVVCYTNHALDQFLEALLDKGITDVVRIGGRSKSEAVGLKQLLTYTVGGRACELDPDCPRQQEEEQQEQQPASSELPPPPQPPYALDLWQELGPFLQEEYPDTYDDMYDPYSRTIQWREWLSGRPAPGENASVTMLEEMEKGGESGSTQSAHGCSWQTAKPSKAPGVVSYGRAEAILFERVARGEPQQYASCTPAAQQAVDSDGASGSDGGSGRAEGDAAGHMTREAGAVDMWKLGLSQRLDLASKWLRELRARWGEELAHTLVRAREVSAELRALQDDDASRSVLSGARVIGMTTTGAAMHKDLLRDADVEPGVVLVEEAGELLEAHVLTSLGPRTKQLIMIGDHKQLRPKVECWPLSVQSGHGHDLNVSLFERLVLSGFPHTTLAKQHRMHLDISALVRPTYPALEDAERVHRHPPVLGLPPGRRVVFVDHREPELGEKDRCTWSGTMAGPLSKVNEYEVSMVCATVRYLLLQGYRPEQLVVLTPYLGQLLEMQLAISQHVQVLLDELDLRDLRAARNTQALLADDGSRDRPGVRIATIDNYQGEEADVVIASLVRSNDSGSVGFLREPERINVLLSRARHGMILIGNAATLRNAKSPEARRHWGRVLGALDAAGAVTRGLPVACQSHGTVGLVDTPEAFVQLTPDGGCQRPCHAVLPCGHPCMRRCHPCDPGHEYSGCAEETTSDVSCQTCVELRRIDEDQRRKLAKLEQEVERTRRDDELQAAKLRAWVFALELRASTLQEGRPAQQKTARLEKELELQASGEHFATLELSDDNGDDDDVGCEGQRLSELRLDEGAQVRRQAEEEQSVRRQLDDAVQQLRELEARRDCEVTDVIAGNRQRLEAAMAAQRRAAEAAAERVAQRYSQMSSWKEAVAQVAKQGTAGLACLRQQLRASASAAASGATDVEGALDKLFREPNIGACLASHAMADTEVFPGANAASTHGDLRRGLGFVKDGKWLDALKFFTTLADPPPAAQKAAAPWWEPGGVEDEDAEEDAAPDVDPVLAAFMALCRAKLGLPQLAQLPRTPFRMTGGAPNSPASPATSDAASESSLTTGVVGSHPVEPLAMAMVALQRQRSAMWAGAHGQRSEEVRAVGWALAFLLHPRCGEMPGNLRDEALQLLRDHAPSLSAPALPVAQAAANGSVLGRGLLMAY
ncbi:hypothetical protein GPECTOR_10g1015 [Gonium pectorale]|uniref:Helicase ATP-binding domain-containing protein n=1 Tax=Gonium pectorale TaxID=33097 RepID=A0A150GQD9_GONPE|nr:hypothetical protein GPECTOR_10g1015 [Gonium pectorale]|eukprot:KXZ51993.1 hypothetical protein GPECTOR_10g1015 [Gonium pectorale]